MRTLAEIILGHSLSPKDITNEDYKVCNELQNVKTVDEWNEKIKEIASIPLRADIEQSGIIHQILGGQA